MSFPSRGMVRRRAGGSCLAPLRERGVPATNAGAFVEVTGRSGDGFVSLSDAADNVAGRPGGSAKWLPALMQQRLQREAGRSDECFSGKKKLK